MLGWASLSSGAHVGPNRYPLWELFVAIGGIGVSGGIASVFAGPDLDEPASARSDTVPSAARRAPSAEPLAAAQPLEEYLFAQSLGRPLDADRPTAPGRGAMGSLASAPLRGSEPRPRTATPPDASPPRPGRPGRSTTSVSLRELRAISEGLHGAPARRRAAGREGSEEVGAELDSLVASLARAAPPRAPRVDLPRERSRCGLCGRPVSDEELPGECDQCGTILCEVCTALGEAGRGPILCASCAGTATGPPSRRARTSWPADSEAGPL